MCRIGLVIVKAGGVRGLGLVSVTVIGLGVFITRVSITVFGLGISVGVCWRFRVAGGSTVTSFGFSSINCNKIENKIINFRSHSS